MARTRVKDPLPRASDDGHIDNCALANGKPEAECQMCPAVQAGCPDRTLFTGPSKDAVDLVRELEEADKETAKAKARAIVFDSANAAIETPIDPKFARVVERLYAPKDWEKVQDRFEAWLSLGDRRTEEAFIRKAHEEGPEILRDLYGAYLQIRLTREAWELENDTVLGAMRLEATKALQEEKNRGSRNKTITKEDVADQAASMFPDEWSAQETKRLKYKGVEDRAKHDVEVAGTRCRHLDTMMSRLRGG